jgi:outer membrane protein assembly factor BamB
MKRWTLLPLVGLVVLAAAGSDWRQFRGSDLVGVAAADKAPEHFAPDKNIAWKSDLPGRGLSSPVIVGERIFLTASSGAGQDRLRVLAFDVRTGRQLWQRSFWATGPTKSHPKTCMAAPTPAADGHRLVALFATNDLVCLDFDGDVRWVRSLAEENPGVSDGRGFASSPVIVGETVVVQMDNQNNSFAVGIDLRSGKNRWKVSRPAETAWTTPIVLPGRTPGDALLLLQGSTRLSAIEPQTGKEVWKLDRAAHPVASSALAGNILYVPGEKGLMAFELQPNHAPPKPLWEEPRLNPDMASPVVVEGKVYSLKGGILVTGDAKTGEVRGRLRLKGPFSSSIIAAGGVLYCVNEDGLAQVVRPGDQGGELIASCPFEETILCTPAVANGALYLRSDKHLWKIAQS